MRRAPLPLLLLLLALLLLLMSASCERAASPATGAAAAAASMAREAGGQRIVGGAAAPDAGRDFVVVLYKAVWRSATEFSLHVSCGGALIAPSTVLTAAHCAVTGIDFVGIGDRTVGDADSFQHLYGVASAETHPDFDAKRLRSDVALLHLMDAAQGMAPAPLIFADPAYADLERAGADARVAGWGATSEGGSGAAQLQEAEVVVVSNAYCGSSSVLGAQFAPELMLCAGNLSGGHDACQGDSGGPLFGLAPADGRPVLIGVVSFGVGCARARYPGVYARVSSFEAWLRASVPALGQTAPRAAATARPTVVPDAGMGYGADAAEAAAVAGGVLLAALAAAVAVGVRRSSGAHDAELPRLKNMSVAPESGDDSA